MLEVDKARFYKGFAEKCKKLTNYKNMEIKDDRVLFRTWTRQVS